MEYRQFFDEIKRGSVRRLYLLHGEEEYAKDKALDALLATTEEATRDFNVSPLVNPDIDGIVAACEMLPLMADRRLVIVRECRYFAAGDEAKRLCLYIETLGDTTTLVFLERGCADARKMLYKAIEKAGAVVKFDCWDEMEAMKLAVNEAKKRGVTLPQSEAQLLVFMTGKQLSDVVNETIKVCDYAGLGQTVTKEMVENCVHRNIEYTVFKMFEFFLAGKTGDGFTLLQSSLREEGAGAAVASMMFFASRIRLMLDARRQLDAGIGPQKVAQNLGGNPYAAQMSVKAAQKFTKDQLEEAILTLAEADYAIKSGLMKDVMALETALVRIFKKGSR